MFDDHVDRIFSHLGVRVRTSEFKSPISPGDIITRFGIKLRFEEMPDDLSGAHIRSNKGTYIFINKNHSKRRKRFSMGHEFGHHFLGHPSDMSLLLNNAIPSRYEKEANQFSACLLMPPDVVFDLHKKMPTIRAMADWLQVSTISVAFRCKTLGIRYDEADDIISDYHWEQGDAELQESSYMVVSTISKPPKRPIEVTTKPHILTKCSNSIHIPEYPAFLPEVKPLKLVATIQVKTDENGRFKICPRCRHSEFSHDANYCKMCGLRLYNECTNEPPLWQDHCGRVNVPDARYCEYCGSRTYLLEQGLLDEVEHVMGAQREVAASIDDDDLPW